MTYALHLGDCIDVMRWLQPNSVDAIVTDPPYGLAFMGKAWDHAVPGPEFFAAMLRVAKPGAHLFAFGGTRLYHRMTCAIEDAGWEIRDCLSWLYGSGFPKSLAIDKAIDKAASAERPVVGPGGTGFASGTGRHAGQAAAYGFRAEYARTSAASAASAAWSGWGTALKPAWEPIVLAMKPLDGTFAANAEKWGVAGLCIDGGRISASAADVAAARVPRPDTRICRPAVTASAQALPATYRGEGYHDMSAGRWPANVALDGAAAAVLDAQAGERSSGVMRAGTPRAGTPRAGSVCYGAFGGGATEVDTYGDTGGPSRFFYTSKAGREDRTDGNTHPTVKPTDLMRWLVRLAKPPGGGVILDPFMGSGSTGVACIMEGARFIGIEREPEYLRIAEARIKRATRCEPETIVTRDGSMTQLALFATEPPPATEAQP